MRPGSARTHCRQLKLLRLDPNSQLGGEKIVHFGKNEIRRAACHLLLLAHAVCHLHLAEALRQTLQPCAICTSAPP